MFKEAVVLTLPTPARRDAPFRGKGRSYPLVFPAVASVRFTLHEIRFRYASHTSMQRENTVGGLFQHSADQDRFDHRENVAA